MTTPRQRVILLLTSLYDYLHLPETSTGTMLRKSLVARQPAPMSWAECPDCHGDRVTQDRFRRQSPCDTCRGGTRNLPLGRIRVDDYTGQPVGSQETTTITRTRTRRCDRCNGTGVYGTTRCHVCDGSGTREWSPFELDTNVYEPSDPLDYFTRKLETRDEIGDWWAVEQALANMAKYDRAEIKPVAGREPPRGAHALVMAVHVLGGADPALGEAEAQTLRRGVDWLTRETQALVDWRERQRAEAERREPVLPAPIRVPPDVLRPAKPAGPRGAQANRHQLEQRDEQIRAAFDAGAASAAELKLAHGLSERQLRRILNGETAA